MKASPSQFYKFMQRPDTQFVIPIYQRNYDWSEEQCKQLLDDIIDVGRYSREDMRVHFVGSIVYVCNDEYTTDEIEQYVIIDGQQRITTLTLLLIALYHFARKENDKLLAETIYEYYLVNKNAVDDATKIKLKATDNNEKDLQLLLDNRSIYASEYSNIKNNYNFFIKNINATNRNVIYEGFKRLLFVEIRLERGKDNAQKIFESLNSTGLDLSQADLIRNYILMGLEPSQQSRLFNKYWSVIEANTKVNGVSYVSDFIRDYLTIKIGDIPNKNRVYNVFKQQFRIENNLDLDAILEEILRYSDVYRLLLCPNEIADEEIRKELNYIKYIEINVSYPFLLQVVDDFRHDRIDKKSLLNILRFIQTYVCRRFVLDLPTNALNKIFMNLYRQIDQSDYERSLYYHVLTRSGKVRMPSDAEILNYLRDKDLYTTSSKMKYYILERIENYNNKEYVPIIDSLSRKTITIEHIFPQNPEPGWRQILSDNEYKQFQGRYLHTLGNLTLSGNNAALGNKVFTDKQSMNKDEGEQGYRFSRLWLNRFLCDIDKWNVDNYRKRTEMLEKRFLKIWALPNDVVKDSPEYNICEIDLKTIKIKEIEYAVFLEEKLSGDRYKGIKLYKYILSTLMTLYSGDEQVSFMSKLKNIVKLSEHEEDFRNPQPLNSTYFYETALSAPQIFSNLKKILEALELTDALFVKLRQQ